MSVMTRPGFRYAERSEIGYMHHHAGRFTHPHAGRGAESVLATHSMNMPCKTLLADESTDRENDPVKGALQIEASRAS